MKVKEIDDTTDEGRFTYVEYYCPGCERRHHVPVSRPDGGVSWGYNNDVNNPTLTPSVKHTANYPDGERICHYFVTAGNINYCSDSTHKLAGQQVEMQTIKD